MLDNSDLVQEKWRIWAGMCERRMPVNCGWLQAICKKANVEFPWWMAPGSASDDIAFRHVAEDRADAELAEERLANGFYGGYRHL